MPTNLNSSTTNNPIIPIIVNTPSFEAEEGEGAGPPAVGLQQSRRFSSDSDVSTLVLSPRPTQSIPMTNFLHPPTHQHPRTPPPPASAQAPPSMGEGVSSPQSDTPYGLRPTAHDTHHAPHPLDGPRHTSRTGIGRNDDFARHCLKYGPWLIDRPADPHTTVKIGHGSGVAFRHFEAEFLDFAGVKAIKIVHPLCATQLRGLDWDVMRSVAVHLRQYIGTRAVSTSIRSEAVQKAEKLSLGMVERELESRNWERKRAKDHLSGSDGSDAGSDSSEDDPLFTSLSFNDLGVLGVTSVPSTTATPPERSSRRPEFNTRHSYRRTNPVSEANELVYPVLRGSKSNLTASHVHGSLTPPDIETCPARDSQGTSLGQDSIDDRDARLSRSSRDGGRDEDFPDEALGVNYGCTGRGRWF